VLIACTVCQLLTLLTSPLAAITTFDLCLTDLFFDHSSDTARENVYCRRDLENMVCLSRLCLDCL